MPSSNIERRTLSRSQHERERIAFGEDLKSLRKLSKLTGVKLALLTGISQSKLSKIETGSLIPSSDDLAQILIALNVSEHQRQKFLATAQELRTEYLSWRFELRGGLGRMQLQAAETERRAKSIRELRIEAIPGLLQTREYAQRVMTLATSDAQPDLEWAITLRMQRQETLYDPERKFQFLIYETGLFSRFCDAAIVARQLERLRFLSDSPNISIGFIPHWISLPRALIHSFVLFDSTLASFEFFSGEISISDRQDVAMYAKMFNEFAAIALFGDAASAFLRDIELALKQKKYFARA